MKKFLIWLATLLVLAIAIVLYRMNSSSTAPTATIATGQQNAYSLNFDSTKYTTGTIVVSGQTIAYRAFENIVYVQHPADVKYEVMNIYVPEAYYQWQSINGYTAANAPVLFQNQVGGYMPSTPGTIDNKIVAWQWGNEQKSGDTSKAPDANTFGPQWPGLSWDMKQWVPWWMMGDRPNTIAEALAHGYVVASPGTRGRTTQDASGKYTGKAPDVIVDLKAAVRYLHYNDASIPGDSNKIISNGTSAGWAVSALLGASANSSLYDSYLTKLWAAPVTDSIYAVSSYCPITNLENADTAYEWLLSWVNSYSSRGSSTANMMTTDQISLSQLLSSNFPAYLNSLWLKDSSGNILTLDKTGNGSFKKLLKTYIIQSAQIALDTKADDLSKYSWITIKKWKVTDINLDKYITQYLKRMKTTPAFDSLDLSSPETSLFGTETLSAQHFTQFWQEHSTVTTGTLADSWIIAIMNPMTFVSTSTTMPHYWRIRHGAKDSDTAVAVPLILSTVLQNHGYSVDFQIPWTQWHGWDYDLPDLFTWIDGIVK